MSSTITRLNGTDLILSVDGVAIAHATSNSFSSEMATIDVSSKDSAGNQENIGGQKSFTIDFEGLTDFSASGYGFDNLFDCLTTEQRLTGYSVLMEHLAVKKHQLLQNFQVQDISVHYH